MPRWIRHLCRHKGERRPANGEAEAALQRAESDLKEIRGRATEVDRAVARLREIRQQNHFAERFDEIFGGGGG
ncbi:hypothetical protein OG552_11085 [Streptomyces sp. NBC_01476]|uniref:DUF7620 family protein n=1 Tax=Streptomyces sp. NBC_01476 TaxID=2903881 RepID=UPI002E358264|nr:hypothetical protein [Streptomyces sp. NBC_01476]